MSTKRIPSTSTATTTVYTYTATASQTTFSGADGNGLTLAYTVGSEQVYLNGVLLVRVTDYTASTGSSVVLASGATVSDILSVVAYTAFTLSTDIPKSTLSAKGSIVTATGASTPANLAVGDDGAYIVANSAASSGLSWAGPMVTAGKNALINGAFDIWQRGTSFTNPGSSGTVFSADRWLHYFNGNGTVTQETTVKPDTSTYSLKITATGSSSSNDSYQLIEQLNMEQFRGKTVTLSVKVAGTATLTPILKIAYSTTANDSLFNTSTDISGTIIANPTINASTFVTYSSTFAIPTTAKTLRIGLWSLTMANTNVLYWAEPQLELGSIPTAFSRAGGTIAGELAACERYYNGNVFAFRITSGVGTGLFYAFTTYLPPMRTIPTLAFTSAAAATNNISGTPVMDVLQSDTGNYMARLNYNSNASSSDTYYVRAFSASAEL